MFELNSMKTTEDDEACGIGKEIERAKRKERVSKLEVKSDEAEIDSKDEAKEFDVFKKESKVRNEELEEQARE